MPSKAYNVANGTAFTATAQPRLFQSFTPTVGQTTFTLTNGYVVGSNIEVWVNGQLLEASDYTATNSSTIVLNTPIQSATDSVLILSYAPTWNPSFPTTGIPAATYSGNTQITGAVTASNAVTLSNTTNFTSNVAFTSTVGGLQIGGQAVPGRNKVINGDMRVDQRNIGATQTPSSGSAAYVIDRWQVTYGITSGLPKFTVGQNLNSLATLPVGYKNYIGVQINTSWTASAGDYLTLYHIIEGYNSADLSWGTANARPVTVSFWVYSSVTGTYSVSLRNGATTYNNVNNFTINSANTWEFKTITVTGPTVGVWSTDINAGVQIIVTLMSGSTYQTSSLGSWVNSNVFNSTTAVGINQFSGAVFYLTGVQLEVGTVATSFERLAYDQQLEACQRYYVRLFDQVSNEYNWVGYGAAGNNPTRPTLFPVQMRTTPVVTKNGTWGVSNFTGPLVTAPSRYGVVIYGTITATNTFTVSNSNPTTMNITADADY